MSWDRDAALKALVVEQKLSGPNLIIGRMWVYHHDLEWRMKVYSEAKTEYDRRLSRIVIQMRNEGERNYDVCKHVAHMDDEVHNAHLAYRMAEQMVTADREALRILHAQLDAYRTEAADQRAADQFQARTQT